MEKEDPIDRGFQNWERQLTNYRQYVQCGGAYCNLIMTEPQLEKLEHSTTGVGDHNDDCSTVLVDVRSFLLLLICLVLRVAIAVGVVIRS